VRVLIEISSLLDATPEVETIQKMVTEMYKVIAPIMQARGLGLYIPDRFDRFIKVEE
jgi:hypothetical protein